MKLTEKYSERGFSLVEVTVAMAIAAVAVVSILGLLPQGLETMREAGDEAIKARIHQQILNEIQMTPFKAKQTDSPIEDYNGLELFYDQQGEELETSDEGSFEHIYSARVTIPKSGDSFPNSVTDESEGSKKFDGMRFAEKADVNEYIRPVIVEVAAVGGIGKNFEWDEDKYRPLISVYQTYVVQMGNNLDPKTP